MQIFPAAAFICWVQAANFEILLQDDSFSFRHAQTLRNIINEEKISIASGRITKEGLLLPTELIIDNRIDRLFRKYKYSVLESLILISTYGDERNSTIAASNFIALATSKSLAVFIYQTRSKNDILNTIRTSNCKYCARLLCVNWLSDLILLFTENKNISTLVCSAKLYLSKP